MGEEKDSFPCSICDLKFENPRVLGTHILERHCDEEEPHEEKLIKEEALDNEDDFEEDIEEDDDDRHQEDAVERSNNEWAESLNNHRFNNKVTDLPRSPTNDERSQQFMIHRMSDYSTRYICLICSKAYTSRYNIRMHMNLHLGRNVHSCSYCGRYFAHKHVYESHLRTHTGEKPFPCNKCGRPFSDRSNCSSHQKKCRSFKASSLIMVLPNGSNNNNNNNNDGSTNNPLCNITLPQEPVPLHEISDRLFENSTEIYTENAEDDISLDSEDKFEPQIVSVESCNEDDFPVDDLEEIQIEPDIIDYEEDNNGQASSTSSPPSDSVKLNLTTFPPSVIEGSLKKVQPLSPAVRVTPTTIFTCSFCNAKFNRQEYLLKHLTDHVNVPTSPQQEDYDKGYIIFYYSSRQKSMCLSCGKIFSTEAQVKIHLNVHYGENIYNCRFCEKVFSDFGVFENHIKTHSEEFKYTCKYCDHSFMSRMVLVQHIKTCSSNNDLFQNSVGSPSNDSFTIKPKRSMPTLKPLEGEAKKIKTEVEMEEDEEEEDTTKYTDDYIPDNNSNNVISKSAIQPPPTAEEKKTGFCLRELKNGQTRFICVKCGKHYTTNYNMRQHLNIHTGKGLHTCRYCSRSFTHKHVWETHERIHTGERPFKCSFCPKDFADRSNYNSHRKLCAVTKQRNGLVNNEKR